MSDTDRQRWNQRYTAPPSTPPQATELLRHNRHLLPVQGRALDLACGRGGNALLLAGQGLITEAWDIAERVLMPLQQQADAQQLPLMTRQVDLDLHSLPNATFDVICVSGYLNRALCPAISAALRPGGLLFYQTFTRDHVGTYQGPSNPAFLLAPGELLRLFADLQLVVYREDADAGDLTQGLRNQAGLIGRRISQR